VSRLVARAFDIGTHYVRLSPDGGSEVIAATGPPPDVEGHLVGVAAMTKPPPHGGERHADGDELLVVLSGGVAVTVEGIPGEHQVAAGQALVIPARTWHQVRPTEPCRLLFITPGPDNSSRPVSPR
jgi:mannose-6-phosphate isomerase-like protein (cupin superfamily)